MVNLVQFWQDQTDKWNEEQKCGLCWNFSAPLIESAVNLVGLTDETKCCVQVMLLQDKQPAFTTVRTYDQRTALETRRVCNQSFQLLVLLPADIGTNNYNEVKGHPTTESKWDVVLYRLQECLMCDAEVDFCAVLGRQYLITNWSAVQVINYSDQNYSGYRLSVTFQDIK